MRGKKAKKLNFLIQKMKQAGIRNVPARARVLARRLEVKK